MSAHTELPTETDSTMPHLTARTFLTADGENMLIVLDQDLLDSGATEDEALLPSAGGSFPSIEDGSRITAPFVHDPSQRYPYRRTLVIRYETIELAP